MVTILKKQEQSKEYTENKSDYIDSVKPNIDVELLTPNEYSRPGIATNKIIGIVVHYTANPGATAMNNRDYFEGLKDSHITKASSNFVVGLEGEIVQCVPTWEIAYASNSRNIDTVSIECCHPDETGIFNKKTYQSMVDLCAWLCLKFDLDVGWVTSGGYDPVPDGYLHRNNINLWEREPDPDDLISTENKTDGRQTAD